MEAVPFFPGHIARVARMIGSRKPPSPLLGMLMVMLLAAAAVIAWGLYQRRQQIVTVETSPQSDSPSPNVAPSAKQQPAARQTVLQSAKETTDSANSPPLKTAKVSSTSGTSQPTRTVVPAHRATPPQPSIDGEKQAAFRRELAAARAALTRRDFSAAARAVEAADKLTQTDSESDELSRVDLLIGNLREFWKRIAEVVASLEPAQEITFGKRHYIVVQATPQLLTLRSEGKNQAYDPKNLPRPIVEALAQSCFASDPSSKVLLGTYLAVDPAGDRQRARQLWQEAAQEGQDIRALVQELVEPSSR